MKMLYVYLFPKIVAYRKQAIHDGKVSDDRQLEFFRHYTQVRTMSESKDNDLEYSVHAKYTECRSFDRQSHWQETKYVVSHNDGSHSTQSREYLNEVSEVIFEDIQKHWNNKFRLRISNNIYGKLSPDEIVINREEGSHFIATCFRRLDAGEMQGLYDNTCSKIMEYYWKKIG